MITIPYPNQNAQCITIQSATQIYVYPTARTRETWTLIGDTWVKTAESTSAQQYNYGYCQPNISDGFPYAHQETEVYFNILAIAIFLLLMWGAYRLIIKKLWRRI